MNDLRTWVGAALLLAMTAFESRGQAKEDPLRTEALAAMKRAATYYREKVGVNGGYVYYYSLDLTQRWGEGKAAADIAFVQPPGTPTVGTAYRKAFATTYDDDYYHEAAKEAAKCLMEGQLSSGGWPQSFVIKSAGGASRPPKKEPYSSLDDGQTQSALRFLMSVASLDKSENQYDYSAMGGLDALVAAQFPNGAFPQGWSGPAAKHPIVKAKYPDYDWKTEGRVKNFWDFYTLNDNLAGSVADTLIAAEIYDNKKYRGALTRLGDFLILAQMPDPQPAWCQQYNYEMVPIWARKFEPPAIAGSESQDVMETLIKIARITGEKKYLEPIPRALQYLSRCQQFDGKVARYYELKTNKPLFMDKNYQLTYDDSDVPAHYGWKQPHRFDRIAKEYQSAVRGDAQPAPAIKAPAEAEVRRVIRELDSEGRWVSTFAGEKLVGQPKFEPGFRYLSSEVFARNMGILCDYIAAKKPE